MHLQWRGALTSELTAQGTFSPLPHDTTGGNRHIRGACSCLSKVGSLRVCALAGLLLFTVEHHLEVDLFKSFYRVCLDFHCSITLLQEALENLANVI